MASMMSSGITSGYVSGYSNMRLSVTVAVEVVSQYRPRTLGALQGWAELGSSGSIRIDKDVSLISMRQSVIS